MTRFALLFVTLLTFAACAEQPSLDSQVEALIDASARWRAAAVADDVDLYLSFIVDEAVYLPPDLEPLVGKPAISAFVRGALDAISVSEVLNNAEPVVSGDLGYLWGTYDATYTVKADGSQIHELGNHLFIWQMQTGGEWKLTLATWNTKPDSLQGHP